MADMEEERDLGYFFGDPTDLLGLDHCVASMLAGVRGKPKCCFKKIRMNI